MGWLANIFKKSNSNDKETDTGQMIRINTNIDRKGFIKENCEIITESYRQIEEAKVEYQAVTSYLNDIQKIDMIPKPQREELEEAARNIYNLNKERNKYQRAEYKISDIQYRLFEQDEMGIPKELVSIKNAENYQKTIEEDISHLEYEKQSILDEEDEIINKQSFLRGIGTATFIVVILLFVVFAILSNSTGSNLTLPFLLTVLMGMASALYIFMEARKNTYDINVVKLKLNKVIMLSNKVAIKSVNNRSYLDYVYSKYLVDDYNELKERWEEYIKLKDENKKYQNNTQLLEFYNDILIKELKKYHIADAEVWIYQPIALIDNKEMVEVRHRLNVRRQKLRERMEVNQKQKEEASQEITSLIRAYPDSKDDALRILKQYQIDSILAN
ncbi:MAG: hypothetical protein GX237_06810 [Clostridiales bacterium]|nr:hypothetical protein [Clostridiales bacterium]